MKEKDNKAKFVRLEIKNYKGIASKDLVIPGGATVISGSNGAGKSSVVEAIQALINPPKDKAGLVKKGQQQAYIFFDANGIKVQRTFDIHGKTTVNAMDNDKSLSMTELKMLFAPHGLNPVEFATEDEKTQRRKILQLVELPNAEKAISDAMGCRVDLHNHPLEEIDVRITAIAAERRDVGREKKKTESALEQARKAVPEEFDPHEYDGTDTAQLMKKVSEANSIKEEKERIKNELTQKRRELTDLQDRVAEVSRKERSLEGKLAKLEVPDVSKESKMLEQRDQWSAAKRDYDRVRELESSAEELKNQHEQLDQKLKKLRELPEQLIEKADMPFDGLTIEGGRVCVANESGENVPVSSLSEGERLMFACRLIKRLGENSRIKLCLIDGAERLTPENREKVAEFFGPDWTLIQTVTTPGEMTVETAEELPF